MDSFISEGLLARLTAAREGSREAMGELFEDFRRYLTLVARRELMTETQAKGGASDIVQETFMEAQRSFARFQGQSEGELLAWLRRLLLDNVANFHRLHHAQKRSVHREVTFDHPDVDRPGEAESPSRIVAAVEESSRVEQAVMALPPDYRQVILLRHRDGLSYEEIGAIMNRSAEASRKLWARAVEKLQEQLAPT